MKGRDIVVNHFRNYLPGRQYVVFYAKNVNGTLVYTIGLSVDDYDLLTDPWRSIFYSAPYTLAEFADYAALWAAVSAEPTLNDEYVLGTETKAVLVYLPNTTRYVLNKALRWLGLPQVEPILSDRYINLDHYTNMEHYA